MVIIGRNQWLITTLRFKITELANFIFILNRARATCDAKMIYIVSYNREICCIDSYDVIVLTSSSQKTHK